MEKDGTARILARLRNVAAGRKPRWRAQAGPLETGDHAFQAGALDELSGMITEGLQRGAQDPAFWNDDQGGMWVTVPDALHGGHRAYRISGGTARFSSFGSGDAEHALDQCTGITHVPSR